ncbi:MAG: DUF262 domain-containing protein [Chitinophagaceae bacterium]|nr:MAG: DUF262 domain-containing protein [Chitinophagaceae bacterium]
MNLEQEISLARKEIISDGYEMSVGEIINLYTSEELFINPAFQRLFRWDESRKTRFIESLLLGIPIPPIFVYQNADGVWELIDGLQRLSTILEFVGVLKDPGSGDALPPLVLGGTKFLPSLANCTWDDFGIAGSSSIGRAQQLQVKRARLRVEILKQESDVNAKFELFQRLNTGGLGLSEQEVRNSVAVMMDAGFYEWLNTLANDANFRQTIDQTESALEKQMHIELALRFLIFRHVPYTPGLDVHEYLDDSLVQIIADQNYDRGREEWVFQRTFEVLNEALGESTFKKWDGARFKGKFLMSLFEVIAPGVSKNIEMWLGVNPEDRRNSIADKSKQLWQNEAFVRNNGAGVRGTTRLANLLPLGGGYFSNP